MNELQLGLIGAGAVIVAAVMGYNAWQGARIRRRMPRPMPEEAKLASYKPPAEHEESPFIDPSATPRREPMFPPAKGRREPTFASPAADQSADLAADGASDEAIGAMTAEPRAGDAPLPAMAHDARRDPAHQAPPVVDAQAAALAAAVAAETPVPVPLTGDPTPSPVAADDAGRTGPVRGDPPAAEAIAPATHTISAAPPGVIDRRIDCIVPVRLAGPLAGDRIVPAAQKLRRAGSKPVFIEGRAAGTARWENIRAVEHYDELRVAVQLANRSGPLNELEFSEFVGGVHQFADAFDGAPDFPEMLETVAMARELDAFAAQCDAQLSLNVMSDGAPWSANYVQAVASQDGLLLTRDGTRFVKLDARHNPVFMLQFGDTNFLRDDLAYKGGQMITLLLDVPCADEDILPFRLMCDYAASLSQRIGARVVDDQRRPLPDSALVAIDKQLMTLYGKLDAAGMPAGSTTARRLFSH
jgi:hypothetical protein